MSHRFLASVGILAVGMCVAFLSPAPLTGQDTASPARTTVDGKSTAAPEAWIAPRTPDGQPDMRGIWTTSYAGTLLERPSELAGKETLTAEEAAEYRKMLADRLRKGLIPLPRYDAGADEIGSYNNEVYGSSKPGPAPSGPMRTSLIVEPRDGRIPLTPAAEARLVYNRGHRTDSYEYMIPWERCITQGLPYGMLGVLSGYLILQTPGYVVITNEVIHETRTIPLDGRPHLPQNIRLWLGDSRGHWEGDTLVVDTTNFNDKGVFEKDNGGIMQSEALHLVERFTLVEENTLNYEVIVEDPAAYTRPWKVVFPYRKDPTYQIFEYACHEGNDKAMELSLTGESAQSIHERQVADEAVKKAPK